MRNIDEAISARLYLGSDRKTVVSEGDVRARILLAPLGPVSRSKAAEIRGYPNGDLYLYPVGGDVPVVPEIKAPPEAPPEEAFKPAFFGTDDVLNFGEHAGVKVRDLDEEYLRRMTYVAAHEEWTKMEEVFYHP